MRYRIFLLLLLVAIGGHFFYFQDIKEDYTGASAYLGIGLGVGDITEQVKFARKAFSPDPVIYSIDFFWDELFPDDIAGLVLRKEGIINIRWSPVLSDSYDPFSLLDIKDGIWDDHIKDWAKKAKAYEYPLLISFASNFNDKSSGGFVIRDLNAQKTEFLEAYKRIVSLFKEEGAVNVMWVWSATLTDSSLTSLELKELYPTGNIVDWLGASVDINKTPDVLAYMTTYQEALHEQAYGKPFILDLHYSEIDENTALAFQKGISVLDPNNVNIDALIFNFSGPIPYESMQKVLNVPYFGRDRDLIHNAVSDL